MEIVPVRAASFHDLSNHHCQCSTKSRIDRLDVLRPLVSVRAPRVMCLNTEIGCQANCARWLSSKLGYQKQSDDRWKLEVEALFL
jgi:hypothetical protein